MRSFISVYPKLLCVQSRKETLHKIINETSNDSVIQRNMFYTHNGISLVVRQIQGARKADVITNKHKNTSVIIQYHFK